MHTYIQTCMHRYACMLPVRMYIFVRDVTQSRVSRLQLNSVERRHGLRGSFNAVHALAVNGGHFSPPVASTRCQEAAYRCQMDAAVRCQVGARSLCFLAPTGTAHLAPCNIRRLSQQMSPRA